MAQNLFGGRFDLSQSHGDTEMHEDEIRTAVVDYAAQLHHELGLGLRESVYEVTSFRSVADRSTVAFLCVSVSP